MAVDKLVDSTQLNADLTSVANAIRSKGGTSAQLAFPSEFVQAIEDIETGFVAFGGVTNTLQIEVSVGNTHQRRSFWKNSGDHRVGWSGSSSSKGNTSPYFPHKVPNGATKVIVNASGPGNYAVRGWIWDSGGSTYVDPGFNSGWLNMPASNAAVTIPASVEYVTLAFRANSSNSNYTSATEPYDVSLSFE